MTDDLESLLREALREAAAAPRVSGDPVLLVTSRIRRRSRRHGLAAAFIAVLGVCGVVVGIGAVGSTRSAPIPAGPPSPSGTPPLGPVVASVIQPVALAVDSYGDLLIADVGRHQILRRLSTGQLDVVAGTGVNGFSGDGGPATQAELSNPASMVVASDGTIDFVDGGNSIGNDRIRQISPSGVIRTIVGDGHLDAHPSDPTQGEQAISAAVSGLGALAFGPNDDLYFTEYRQIDRLTASGRIVVVLGYPGGVNVPLADPRFPSSLSPQAFDPTALAFDKAGAMYFANASPKLLMRVPADGVMSLVPGQVDGGTYVSPGGLVQSPDGSVLVANYGFALDDIVDGTLDTITDFGSPVPNVKGYLRPIGVTVAADGTIYAVDSGAAGALPPTLARKQPGGAWTLIAMGSTRSSVAGTNSEPAGSSLPPSPRAGTNAPNSGDPRQHRLAQKPIFRRENGSEAALVDTVDTAGSALMIRSALGSSPSRPRRHRLPPASLI